MSTGDIPRRPFGRHRDLVSALGLGGYHVGVIGTEREAVRLIHAAIDGGVTFLDNAWEYHEGKSEIRMGKAIRDRRQNDFLKK
jgi:aryl-alcohol dehydrogenase-like predicted oxidoreductase